MAVNSPDGWDTTAAAADQARQREEYAGATAYAGPGAMPPELGGTAPPELDLNTVMATLGVGPATQERDEPDILVFGEQENAPDGFKGFPMGQRPYQMQTMNRFGESTRMRTEYGFYTELDPFQMFAGQGEARIWAIQRQMEAAGYEIGSRGLWGPQEIAVMTELMSMGNVNGLTWQDVLKQITEGGGIDRGGRGGGLAPVEHVPEWVLTTMLEEAGTEFLGRNFTDAEKQQFIGAFRDLENSRAPFDSSAAMQAFAQRSDPAGYAANKASDVYGSILQTLTGGAV